MNTLEVIEAVKELTPELVPSARVVGRWVWIETADKPSAETRDVLKWLGFHWNRKRIAWQHPCGLHCKHAPYDPRDKYASVSVSELIPA